MYIAFLPKSIYIMPTFTYSLDFGTRCRVNVNRVWEKDDERNNSQDRNPFRMKSATGSVRKKDSFHYYAVTVSICIHLLYMCIFNVGSYLVNLVYLHMYMYMLSKAKHRDAYTHNTYMLSPLPFRLKSLVFHWNSFSRRCYVTYCCVCPCTLTVLE